jgi:hypothetical protein
MLGWLIENPEEEVSKAIQHNLQAVFRQKTGDDCTLGLLTRIAEEPSSQVESKTSAIVAV